MNDYETLQLRLAAALATIDALERQKAETVQLLRQWDRMKTKIATQKREIEQLRHLAGLEPFRGYP